jgi:branched-chain amino acid transport system substrate-binding protein
MGNLKGGRAMKRITLAAMAVLLAIHGTALAAETYKIGAAFPLTGPAQFLGEAERESMNMAIEEINAKGGVNGQNLEAVYVDTKGEVNAAISVVEKFLNKDNIAFILTTDSNSAMGTMDITERAKALHMTVARADGFTAKGYQYCFRNQPTNQMLMDQYMKDLESQLKTKKLAILVANYPYGLSALDGLKKAKLPSIEIVYENNFPMEASDFTPYLTAIRGSGADTIVLICLERHAIGVVTKYKELELDKKGVRLAGDDHVVEKAVLDAVGDKANGVFGQLVYHRTFNQTAEDFHKAFTAKYGKEPGSILHALGYANVYALYYGLKEAKTNKDTKALADALRKIKYDSPLGSNATFDAAGQLQGASGRLAQVVNLKLEVDPAKWTK